MFFFILMMEIVFYEMWLNMFSMLFSFGIVLDIIVVILCVEMFFFVDDEIMEFFNWFS